MVTPALMLALLVAPLLLLTVAARIRRGSRTPALGGCFPLQAVIIAWVWWFAVRSPEPSATTRAVKGGGPSVDQPTSW